MKTTITQIACLGLTLAGLAAAGCSATTQAHGWGMSTYAEIPHEGRIYVLCNPETIASFEKTHELPVALTKIGAGPNGETVVLEVDKKDPSYEQALWRIFKRQHGMN